MTTPKFKSGDIVDVSINRPFYIQSAKSVRVTEVIPVTFYMYKLTDGYGTFVVAREDEIQEQISKEKLPTTPKMSVDEIAEQFRLALIEGVEADQKERSKRNGETDAN
jgi:hypothetical protein